VIFIIGREPDPSEPRIVLQDMSVSRKHATIAIIGNGSFLLHDADSRNGTYVRVPGGWRKIDQVRVGPEDEIRFGAVVVRVRALLEKCVTTPGGVRLERNPETGEIVRRPA
jgi:pSer/pThr/pTyr-binding forkhead associated (FHA) protein